MIVRINFQLHLNLWLLFIKIVDFDHCLSMVRACDQSLVQVSPKLIPKQFVHNYGLVVVNLGFNGIIAIF